MVLWQVCIIAGSSQRVTSVAIWIDAKSASFIHDLQLYTVLGLLRAGLKLFCGMAAEARSCTCMKAYLVNASYPVLTVLIEFGVQEPDPARAAHIIVQRMKSDAKGVLLHKCEPLYLQCGNVFEGVIPKPFRLMALEHVITQIRQQALETGAVASHWMLHPTLQARGFEAVLLGSSCHLRRSVDASTTETQEWPRTHASQPLLSPVSDLYLFFFNLRVSIKE